MQSVPQVSTQLTNIIIQSSTSTKSSNPHPTQVSDAELGLFLPFWSVMLLGLAIFTILALAAYTDKVLGRKRELYIAYKRALIQRDKRKIRSLLQDAVKRSVQKSMSFKSLRRGRKGKKQIHKKLNKDITKKRGKTPITPSSSTDDSDDNSTKNKPVLPLTQTISYAPNLEPFMKKTLRSIPSLSDHIGSTRSVFDKMRIEDQSVSADEDFLSPETKSWSVSLDETQTWVSEHGVPSPDNNPPPSADNPVNHDHDEEATDNTNA